MDLFRFWLFVHDGGSCSQALGPEPELSGKIISHDVVWKKLLQLIFNLSTFLCISYSGFSVHFIWDVASKRWVQ